MLLGAMAYFGGQKIQVAAGYRVASLNRPRDALNSAMSPANLAGQDRPGKIENNRMAKKKNSPFGLFFSLVSGSYLQLILPYRSH